MKRPNKKILFLIHLFLICYSLDPLIHGRSWAVFAETQIVESSQGQKEAQLKKYFRDYYYKQGRLYYKKARYEEAIVQFEEVLELDPQYKPALTYKKLSEDKLSHQRKIEGQKMLAQKENQRTLEELKTQEEGQRVEEKQRIQKAERETAQEATVEEISEKKLSYRIGKEDVLEISVWHHPELSKEVIVRPDGMISFPLIGDIQASGLSIPELRNKITMGLSEFAKRKLKSSNSKEGGEKGEYLIGFGDLLDISVWRVADLSKEVIVRPDGMISFPLVGDLKTAGLTLVELDEELTKALSNYVKDPQVSVMVKSFGWKKEVPEEVLLEEEPEVSVIVKRFGGKKVIVLGDVAKPGVYAFTGDIRLAEAIALAGDFTKFAVKNNILVIRGDIHKNPQVITANLVRLIKYADLSQNVLIQPQDVIYVPRTVVGNINEFMETIGPWIDTVLSGSDLQTMSKK